MKTFFTYWLPVFVWAGIIFFFSSRPTTTVATIDWTDFVIKKTAHVAEYAILTGLLFRALYNTWKIRTTRLYAFVIVCMGGLYAFSDEIHQSFTPGRNPAVRDVLIDIAGVLLALWFIRWIKNKEGVYKLINKFIYH